jgi:glucosamine--fructose-6-phosphate aminotransferase (isomerizing)
LNTIQKGKIILIENAYLHDILDQPRAIRDTITSLADSQKLNDFISTITPASCQRIVLTGMGGSFHILNPLYQRLIELGYPALMAEASELVYFMPRLLNRSTLLIVVSQSGRSAEIIRLLGKDGERPTIIGITNDASSPLALESDVVALIQAGPEASVSCKTTTASLAALAWIGDIISGKDPGSAQDRLKLAAPAVEQYLARWRDHVETLRVELQGTRHVFVTGRGPSLAAVGLGGMLMKEAAHIHSEGMSSAALRHGPFEMMSEDCFVLVFAGDAAVEPLNRALVADVCKTGAKAALAGPDAKSDVFRLPVVSREIRPIVEMLPLHMISLALAEIAGREAGKFDQIEKVTTTE